LNLLQKEEKREGGRKEARVVEEEGEGGGGQKTEGKKKKPSAPPKKKKGKNPLRASKGKKGRGIGPEEKGDQNFISYSREGEKRKQKYSRTLASEKKKERGKKDSGKKSVSKGEKGGGTGSLVLCGAEGEEGRNRYAWGRPRSFGLREGGEKKRRREEIFRPGLEHGKIVKRTAKPIGREGVSFRIFSKEKKRGGFGEKKKGDPLFLPRRKRKRKG